SASVDMVDFFDSNSIVAFIRPHSKTLPIPAFLFASLQLAGDPTVFNSSGYPTLGLVSQGDITSSPTGAVFTFGGIQQVGLIALNASINLCGISFAKFGQLFIFAGGLELNRRLT